MMALCVSAGSLAFSLYFQDFTLAWMHSVEKVRWEEDWSVGEDALHLLSARIKGSGAGMEPPDDAVYKNGSWHYTPRVTPPKRLTLAHSPYTTEYELCFDGQCYPLSHLFDQISTIETIVIEACER